GGDASGAANARSAAAKAAAEGGDSGAAARSASPPATAAAAAGRSTESPPSPANQLPANHPRERNQSDAVAGGQGRSGGKCGQDAVVSRCTSTAKIAAAAKRPRDSGLESPAGRASAAKKRTGSR